MLSHQAARQSHRAAVAVLTATIFFVATVGVVWAVVQNNHSPAVDVAVHDGGAWLVNRTRGTIAHVNGSVFEVDARLVVDNGAPTDAIDVVQTNGTVLARQQSQLVPVDTALLRLADHSIAIPEQAILDSAAGYVAIFDFAEGRFWRFPVDKFDEPFEVNDEAALVDNANVGSVSHAALGADGTLYAVGEKISIVDPAGDASEVPPPLDAADIASISALGDRLLLLTSTELGIVDGGDARVVNLTRRLREPTLQAPSESHDNVVAVTADGEVISIDPESGAVTTWYGGLGGSSLAPVRHNGCIFTYANEIKESVRICGGERLSWPSSATLSEPKLRLVNDRVWLDDVWTDMFAYVPTDGERFVEQTAAEIDGTGTTGPPVAVDDGLESIAGETLAISTEQLLANDGGDGIEIVKVLDAENGAVTLLGETIEFTVTGSVGETASFVYTARDVSGRDASARVTIEVRASSASVGDTSGAESASAVAPPAPEVKVMGVSAKAAFVEFFTEQCVQARYEYRSADGRDSGVHQPEFWPDANAQCWTTHGSHLGWWTPELSPGTEYELAVTVVNRAGLASPPAVVVFTTAAESAPADAYLVEPRVFASTCTSITIDVITDDMTAGMLTWLPTDGAGSNVLGSPATIHRQALGGLTPGTTYTFTLILEAEDQPLQPRVFSGSTVPADECEAIE